MYLDSSLQAWEQLQLQLVLLLTVLQQTIQLKQAVLLVTGHQVPHGHEAMQVLEQQQLLFHLQLQVLRL
jgi:hypothetical protein